MYSSEQRGESLVKLDSFSCADAKWVDSPASRLLNHLLQCLAKRDAAPKHLQLTPAAGGFFASVYDEDDVDEVISERVCMEFSGATSWLR
jgi:hypothetical protein